MMYQTNKIGNQYLHLEKNWKLMRQVSTPKKIKLN